MNETSKYGEYRASLSKGKAKAAKTSKYNEYRVKAAQWDNLMAILNSSTIVADTFKSRETVWSWATGKPVSSEVVAEYHVCNDHAAGTSTIRKMRGG